jgi:guanylate kinase
VIFIFSGPSGVGKSTIIHALRQKRDFQFSVSYTSRNIREGEYNGEDYNFVSETEFLKLIDDEFFIEYEKYGRNYYGTSKSAVNKSTNSLILDLEVNGATKLLASNKDYIGIFIDIDDEELINRLKNRGHDEAFIDERMRLAEYQRSFMDKFNYKINNKDINTTVNKILDIIYSLEEK